MFRQKNQLVEPAKALPGRDSRPFELAARHAVLDAPLEGPLPGGFEEAVFGLGCFWGAERTFWQTPGVWSTSVGYAGGFTPNATYEEVCSGRTGHAEVVRVVFDPSILPYGELLRVFWEAHDPTQGYRQGNDLGTQYRSAIYFTSPEQEKLALQSKEMYDQKLRAAGYDAITTELAPLATYYFAEDYHQQYLSSGKNPNGYSCHTSTGVPFPTT